MFTTHGPDTTGAEPEYGNTTDIGKMEHGSLQARLAKVICLIFLGLAGVGHAGSAPSPSEPPRIAPEDQKFITWLVRRTLEQQIEEGTAYELKHRPAHLDNLRCQLAVTLRQGGFVRGVGVSPTLPVLEAAQRAAVTVLEDAACSKPLDSESLASIRIEIEAIGEVSTTPIIPYWGSAQSYTFLEPGVDGIVLQLRGATAALRPSEFITHYTSIGAALRSLNERMNPGHENHQGMVASWFRTTHWHELEPRGAVVRLHRGMVVLDANAVTEQALSDTVRSIADYVLYRQKPAGEFSYQYEPSTDAYTEANNYIRQTDAARGLAGYARRTGEPVAVAAAERAVQALLPHVINLQDVEGAGYFLGPDRSSDLGATALLCLALTDNPRAQSFQAVRDKLVVGMLWLQQPTGRFINVFPPALVERTGESHSGQALLALATVYPNGPRKRIEQAFAAALKFHRDDFRKNPRADCVPWHSQAFAVMARKTGRREYADLVFEMNDWLANCQLHADNCVWPELYGAIDPLGREGVGASSAVYLEGFAEALMLARELGDAGRTKRYTRVVRAAARWVMQLQFRREEGFYVRSRIDCFGGIREAPWDNRIRIDNCTRALTALNRVREVLFPEGNEAARQQGVWVIHHFSGGRHAERMES